MAKAEKIRAEFRRSDFLTTIVVVAHELQAAREHNIGHNESYVIGALYAIWRSQATWENQ